jgi:hypothetical protein
VSTLAGVSSGRTTGLPNGCVVRSAHHVDHAAVPRWFAVRGAFDRHDRHGPISFLSW